MSTSRRIAWAALLALLLVSIPGSAKSACTDAAPCPVAVEASPGFLTVTPNVVEGLGPYVVTVHNAGNVSLNVSFAGLVMAVAPGATNTTSGLSFPQAGLYEVREDASGATATFDVRAPAAPGQSKSAEIMSILLPCLVGAALIAIAVVVLRNGSVHRHNRFFAAYFFLSGLKSFSEGIDGTADTFHAQAPLFPPMVFWLLAAAFCSLAMLPTLMLFVASFPRPLAILLRRPGIGAIAFLPSIAMGALLVAAYRDISYVDLFERMVPVFNVYGTVLSVLAVGYILFATRAAKQAIERTQARFVAFGLLPAFAVGWVITALQFAPGLGLMSQATSDTHVDNLIHFISPLLELLSAAAVAFAILRYNILGISPKFRVGVKSFLVGFIFALVFLTTQFIENVVLQGQVFNFAGEYGSFMLSGVAGIVLFKPIQAGSTKVADRLVPQAKGDDQLKRSLEVYRAQCTYVLRDAHVTPREMEFLRNLRDQLGLTEAQARSIEEKVERILKVDAPEMGASAGTGRAFVAAAAAEQVASEVEVRRAEHPPQGPVTGQVVAPAQPTRPVEKPEAADSETP